METIERSLMSRNGDDRHNKYEVDSRRKVAPLAENHRDKDLVMLGDLPQGLRKLVVLRLGEGVELLLVGNGDDGDAAAVVDGDDAGRHGR